MTEGQTGTEAVGVGGSPDLLPARMVNEFAYCPRLAYLEWVQGEWDDNADTVEGRFTHRRVDRESEVDLPPPEELWEQPDRIRAVRSVLVGSERLGVIARIDLLELDGKAAVPVDYKKGVKPDNDRGAWEPELVQLCLQGLLLREAGYECDSGVLYYAGSRKRVEIWFDDELIEQATAAAAGLRAMATAGRMPPPLTDSPKCVRCSLAGVCLPDEINHLAGRGPEGEIRRLVAPRDTCLPLYVQDQGAWIGKKGERLQVEVKGVRVAEARLMSVSHVALFGNVQISTQAVRELCDHDIPLTYLSQSGWFFGITNGIGSRNIELRIAQHRLADAGGGLAIARAIVAGKIYNQRTMLRRNLSPPDRQLVGRMAIHVRQARHISSADSLLGVEGNAAREYFGAFAGLFRGQGAWAGAKFAENGRNRRPPRDEVNAVLSFLYALLVKECTLAALAVGFDPYRGFFHAPRYGRPSLALDLCEEFRPLIADSACVTLFNQGEVDSQAFLRRARGVALTPEGRKAVIGAFERRLGQEITHPVFGYVVSYRRVLELQARLLRAVVLGEVGSYRPLSTR